MDNWVGDWNDYNEVSGGTCITDIADTTGIRGILIKGRSLGFCTNIDQKPVWRVKCGQRRMIAAHETPHG